MPHYKDGTKANVGDLVVGSTYNDPGTMLGILIKITSEGTTCNCVVKSFIRNYGTEEKPVWIVEEKADYTECKELMPINTRKSV